MDQHRRSHVWRVTAAVLGTMAVAILARAALTAEPEEADPRVTAVLTRQLVYFQSITSLEYHGRLVQNDMPRSGTLPEQYENELHFACSGAKYRSEVTTLDPVTGTKGSLVFAFDGDKYQELTGPPDRLELRVTHSRPTGNIYGATSLILAPFTWAFSPDDERSLTRLQDSDTWSSLSDKVVRCVEAEWSGPDGTPHSGLDLTFVKKPASSCLGGDATYQVFFAADLDYFPVRWRSTIPGHNSCEVQLVSAEIRECPTGTVTIPTRYEYVAHREDGTLANTGYGEIDPHTLRVNEAIGEESFTIPVSGVWHYRDDTGVTIGPQTGAPGACAHKGNGP